MSLNPTLNLEELRAIRNHRHSSIKKWIVFHRGDDNVRFKVSMGDLVEFLQRTRVYTPVHFYMAYKSDPAQFKMSYDGECLLCDGYPDQNCSERTVGVEIAKIVMPNNLATEGRQPEPITSDHPLTLVTASEDICITVGAPSIWEMTKLILTIRSGDMLGYTHVQPTSKIMYVYWHVLLQVHKVLNIFASIK